MKHAAWKWMLLGAVLLLGAPRVEAQGSDQGPALGVARISLTNGDVTQRRGDSGDWVQAKVNMPLVEGDAIATGQGSRAEIELDYSNFLRLHQNTEVIVGELGKRRFKVQVIRGVVAYSELRGGEADVDIETPHVAVRPSKNGLYRVEVLGGDTAVTVRKGEAEIASAEGTQVLKKGRMMLVRGAEEGAEFRIVDADPEDDWDHWNEQRDKQLKKTESYRYLSRSIEGGADLDDHGQWRYVPSYGYSWFPAVGVGWAPYRHGHWIWVDYYGWTWYSYDPWGWAPYHYGRWYHHTHYGWGWYPGHYYTHHYWRPALVAFFGYGHHGSSFGFSFGYGNFGWVPLGPGEHYYPWYGRHYYGGHGRGGHNTIIVDNSVNIYNNYRNARHHNGVTVVDAASFSQGRVNNPRTLEKAELRRATLMRGQIPVVPTRASQGRVVRASNGAQSNALLGQNGVRRNATTLSRQTPRQRLARVPFDQQQQQLQNSVRAFANSDGRRVAGGGSAAGAGGVRAASGETGSTNRGTPRARGATDGAAPGGVRSSGQGAPSSRSRAVTAPATSAAGGVRQSAPDSTRGSRARSGEVSSAPSDRSAGVRNAPAERAGRSTGWRRLDSSGETVAPRSRQAGSNTTGGDAVRSAPDASTAPRSRVGRTASPPASRSRSSTNWRSFENSSGSANSGAPRVSRSDSPGRAPEGSTRSEGPRFSERTSPSRGADVSRSRSGASDARSSERSNTPSGASQPRSRGAERFSPRSESRVSPSNSPSRSASESRSVRSSGRQGEFAPRASSRSSEPRSVERSRSSSRSESSGARAPTRSRSDVPRASRSSGPVSRPSRSVGSPRGGFGGSIGGSRGGSVARSGGGSISRGGGGAVSRGGSAPSSSGGGGVRSGGGGRSAGRGGGRGR